MSQTAKPLTARPASALAGAARIPGDKSISHRALMLAASAVGETRIEGLLEAEDTLCTAAAMSALGARVEHIDGVWRITGCGVGGFAEPEQVLDMGNAGTGVRLLLGLLASQPLLAFLSGDASLSRRPMRRVMLPLGEMGALFWARAGDRLPLAVRGTDKAIPIEYTLPVASAQVKSAILLAGLNAPGRTTVIEPQATRDHSERLLGHFGAEVTSEPLPGGGRRVTLAGHPELTGGGTIVVPGDVSSAAFPLVAALLVPGSRVTLANVGLNPLRTGLIDTLREMGARIETVDAREAGGEPVADLIVDAGVLTGVDVPEARVPSMIDEFPILAAAAACARGTTRMRGLSELRVKESDRLAAIAEGLDACGVRVETGSDWLVVHGCDGPPPGGARVAAHYDHRIAMAFLVLGLAARAPVTIDDATAVATSFPSFVPLMTALGGCIEAADKPAANPVDAPA